MKMFRANEEAERLKKIYQKSDFLVEEVLSR